jgi:hypothetical protein
LRPDPHLRIWITGTEEPNGDKHYQGKLEERLKFRAQMDRRRSWWNPNLKQVPLRYVLQHEQIHFAIAEVEARKLNASSQALTARMHAEGESQEQVKNAIQKKLNDVIEEALGDLVDRNSQFDEDTSARYAPKKQDEWFRRVTAELAEFQP